MQPNENSAMFLYETVINKLKIDGFVLMFVFTFFLFGKTASKQLKSFVSLLLLTCLTKCQIVVAFCV